MTVKLTDVYKERITKLSEILGRLVNEAETDLSQEDIKNIKSSLPVLKYLVIENKEWEPIQERASKAVRALSFVLAGIVVASTAILISVIARFGNKYEFAIFKIYDGMIAENLVLVLVYAIIGALIIVLMRFIFAYGTGKSAIVGGIVSVFLIITLVFLGISANQAAKAALCAAATSEVIEADGSADGSIDADKVNAKALWGVNCSAS